MKRLAWIVILTLGVWTAPAYAKERSELLESLVSAPGSLADSIYQLGSIIVSGKRLPGTGKSVLEVHNPSSTVVTADEIRYLGADTLPDALRLSPGVSFSDLVGNGEEPTINIRGLKSSRDLVVMLDGVRLNEPKSNNVNFPLIPVRIAERIELNRSSSSFLYGEGATAGALNIVTRSTAEDGLHGNLRQTVGSFGAWGSDFEATYANESQLTYLTGELFHERGFRQNSSVEKENAFIKHQNQVTDVIDVSASYLHAEAYVDRSGSIRESYLRQFGPESTERPRNFADLETDLGTLTVRAIPTEDLAWTGQLFIRRAEEETLANFATFDTHDNLQLLSVETWGGASQVDFSRDLLWGLAGNLTFGFDYVNNEVTEDDFNRSKFTLERVSQTVDTVSDKDALGVFSKFTVAKTDTASLYYGIRYDRVEFENTDTLNLGNNQPTTKSKFSHSVGAAVELNPNLSWHGGYSNSFRMPAHSDLYSNPAFGASPVLKPEEADDFETSLDWRDDVKAVSAVYFFGTIKDEIGYDPLASNPSAFGGMGLNTNFGKTRRRGAELLMEHKLPFENTIRGTYTFTDAEFAKDSLTASSFRAGDKIPMIPRDVYTLGFLNQSVSNLSLYLDMIAVSRQVLTSDVPNERNGRRLPAYTVLDFKAQYVYGDWRFDFQIRNLLDEEYEVGGSLGGGSVRDNFFVPAPGRAYYGSVSYTF